MRGLPLTERRARLEARFGKLTSRDDSPQRAGRGDGRALHARAKAEGWEGLIAKEAQSPYHSGRRSPAWRKLKIRHEQEFVVGGWTEPRQTRQHFGALLLGVYEGRTVDRRPTLPTADWLRRPHRHRLHRRGAHARLAAAEAARDRASRRSRRASRPTNGRTGCGPSWSRRSASRSGPTTASCGIRSTSGCATTRIRARSSARSPPATWRHEERTQGGREDGRKSQPNENR